MIYSKVYSLSFDDFFRLEKFKVKRSRTAPLSYLMSLSLIAMTTLNFIYTKSYTSIIICAVILILISLYTVYMVKIKTRLTVRRRLNNDIGMLGRNEVKIYNDSVEFKVMPIKKDETVIEVVYPYALCSAIIECDRYYYFVIGDDIRILPKFEIQPSYRTEVNEVLKKNINYIKVK